MPDLDIARLRVDTPHCEQRAFLDNAGSALPTSGVLETVISHLRRESEVGGYAAAAEAQDAIDAAIAACGALVGVLKDQVALQTSATAAWLRGVTAIPFKSGDRILATGSEYASNVIPLLQIAQRTGATVEYVPNGDDGALDPTALAKMLDDRVRLVALTHAASQNGLMIDVEAVADVLRGHDCWFALDACQSVGQYPIDMPSLGVDVLAATGRKFLRAPRGTGFLALSQRALAELEPYPADMFGSMWDGDHSFTSNSDASRFQSFENAYANVLGLGAAADYALNLGIDEIRAAVDTNASTLRALLSDIPTVRVLDRGTIKSGIVVFSVPGDDALTRVRELHSQNITVSPVNRETNPHDYESYQSNCVLRASPHYYNNQSDLEALSTYVGALR